MSASPATTIGIPMTLRSRFAAFAGAGVLVSFVAACVTTPNAALQSHKCDVPTPGTLGITASRIELVPGETLQMERPSVFVAPYLAPDTLPTACDVRWSVAGGATVSSTGFLTIARDAVPGSIVVVTAQVDTLEARQTVQVVDPAPNPLAATWTQADPPVCADGYRPSDAVVRELVFHKGRTFTVTRTPFESYRDYWGTYSYDVSTGRLELTVDGGNNRPVFQRAGLIARVSNGELILDGPVLISSSVSTGVCRTVFRRAGNPR